MRRRPGLGPGANDVLRRRSVAQKRPHAPRASRRAPRPGRAPGPAIGIALLVAVAASACSEGSTTPGDPPPGDSIPAVRFTEVIRGLAAPVDLTAPAGDARLFVAEQPGRIRIIRDGQLAATPFLDITALVRSGGERGLLGLAFHPRYASTGFFFVSYTDVNGDSRIVRYRVSADPDRADPGSATVILAVPQPQANHNGGQVAFGPDGMLYIGLGDGGGAGDPGGNGQNPNTLLGALLRIDVDGGEPYTIPAGNPYAAGGGRPEIWATGLRNPWRFSFDRERGLLYIADVGQNRREEINIQPAATAGLNYGWNRMEGSQCFPAGSTCSAAGLVLPAVEYPNPAEGCSVTGGYVYRGARNPALRDYYLYGDYCRGWVRALRVGSDGRVGDIHELSGGLGNVLSFGQDSQGEVYVLTAAGTIYRVE
jgi:glucose/arabinose dehydrogenase